MSALFQFSQRGSIRLLILVLALSLAQMNYAASPKPVRGKNGMVVTSHPLASKIGSEILKAGGNAVDAAVAVGYALAVVFPTAGNLGGGGFMVIRFPDGSSTSIDFREKAPMLATRDMYLDSTGEIIPDKSTLGYWACGVPGSVAGLNYALEKYGTMRLKKVIAPAIEIASHGFPVSCTFHKNLVFLAPVFKQFPASAKAFLKQGQPYAEGELFVQKDLARTLKRIAKKGTDAFYRGKIAELIVAEMQKHHGLITVEDLAAYAPKERPTVTGSYRDYEVISMGPPSSGGIAIIQLLNILEAFDLRHSGFNSSRYVHVLAEGLRRVYADRATYLGDPDFWDVPVQGLISKAYAEKLREGIDPLCATPSCDISAGSPQIYESDQTTHYSVIDKNHLAVAVTTTINSGYGSKVVIEGAGFLMNNEMDDFSAKPNTPNLYGLVGGEANAIAPEKRMLSSMSPTIIANDGKPFMVLGAMGGSAIITSVAQCILNVVEHDMNIQEAVDAPRIHEQWLPDEIVYEERGLAFDVLENLRKMGHTLSETHNYRAEVNAILICPRTSTLYGAADSRYDGCAEAF
ncbi:gamma-glutamyltransferase [candidate division KSB1 bacterium]|nr:gamma-glutamyltransferase [candidate division KSB1 bacterium]